MESTAKDETDVAVIYREKENLHHSPRKSLYIDHFYWVFNSAVVGANSIRRSSWTSGICLKEQEYNFF